MTQRQRLTITLRKELLRLLDQTIDGARIRNRSHAIEFLLTGALGGGITKAFIPAGGKGAKMRPFTYEMPKSMMPIKGKPLLEYTIKLLKEAGIKEVIIGVGFLGEKIKEYFADGSRWGIKIIYSEEAKSLGTGGALKLAENFFKETFLMIAGDTLIDINLHDFFEFHKSHEKIATMALVAASEPQRYGIARLRGDKIVSFEEKPRHKELFPQLVNAGAYILEPKIFGYLPSGSSMIEDVFTRLAKEGELVGYSFEGKWFSVDTPEIYEKVIKEWGK